MCGRYSIGLGSDADALLDLFQWVKGERFEARYNVAPGTPIPALRLNNEGERELSLLRWGLVPFWAKDEKIGYKMINARSETAAKKPSFRDAFAKRRCLIPATGYYEWQKLDERGKKKQPYHITLPNGATFAMAGLWERNLKGERPLLTCTILTTEAGDDTKAIHDRMPVILSQGDFGTWLGEEDGHPETLLKPYSGLRSTPVSTLVNSPRNDGPELLEAVSSPLSQSTR